MSQPRGFNPCYITFILACKSYRVRVKCSPRCALEFPLGVISSIPFPGGLDSVVHCGELYYLLHIQTKTIMGPLLLLCMIRQVIIRALIQGPSLSYRIHIHKEQRLKRPWLHFTILLANKAMAVVTSCYSYMRPIVLQYGSKCCLAYSLHLI